MVPGPQSLLVQEKGGLDNAVERKDCTNDRTVNPSTQTLAPSVRFMPLTPYSRLMHDHDHRSFTLSSCASNGLPAVHWLRRGS